MTGKKKKKTKPLTEDITKMYWAFENLGQYCTEKAQPPVIG